MHTNPIVITFCSILYYKNLDKHIKYYLREKRQIESELQNCQEIEVDLKSFSGLLVPEVIVDYRKTRVQYKAYNQNIVNRWFILLMLEKNKQLIKYRSHNIEKKEKIEKEGIFTKVKSAAQNFFEKETELEEIEQPQNYNENQNYYYNQYFYNNQNYYENQG